jgi:alkylation response protein AidB-like acyl-CoA dehydrogenase
VVEQGVFYGQPHSEPVESGSHDRLTVGGRRFGTRAERVDGGYLVNGHKFFVSLAGAAHYYATPALLVGDQPWQERTLYLAIPREAPGVEFTGEWDPLGMRATVSLDMKLTDVWVPRDAEILPTGVFAQLYQRQPYLFLGFSATFLGLMQAAYDYTIAYLTGQVAGAPGLQGEAPARGYAVADMLFSLEATRALYYRVISEQRLDPPSDALQRARAAHVQVQRGVVQLTAEAIRVCGGRAMLKRYPLERYYRDARAAAVMRPLTQDLAMQQTWETALARPQVDASAQKASDHAT